MEHESTSKTLEDDLSSNEAPRHTDAAGFSLESTITRAVRNVRKSQPILIVIPGTTALSFNLPTFEYDNDSSLYTWLKACLNEYAIIIKPSDTKIPRVNDIAEILHLPIYVVLDIPDQDISGMAKSFLSHHDRISYTEIDMVQVNDGKSEASFTAPSVDDTEKADDTRSNSSPSTTFAKLLENHKNGKST